MTLLETITAAAAGAGDPNSASNFPILLDAAAVFPNLTPNSAETDPNGPQLFSGWKIPDSDAESIKSVEKLAKNLRKTLKNPKKTSKDEALAAVNSFPVGKLRSLVGNDVVGLVCDVCVAFDLWEVLETLISQGVIRHCDVVSKLVEKKRSDLICLCLKHVSDIRCSELVSVFEFFLLPTQDSYEGMVEMKREWEKEALLAIEKASNKTLSVSLSNLANSASVLHMMACDGFTPSESCLHYVFSSRNAEGLVMSSAISRLNGVAILRLVRYLRKWLEKYKRFPEAVPCLNAGPRLGLNACAWVPSLESVVRGLDMVLEEHFPYLVMKNEFLEEVKCLEEVVGSLAVEAKSCCLLANVIEGLQLSLSHR